MAIIVRKQPGDDEDKLIAKFRKKIQMDRFLAELKELEFYKKPSVIKKEKLQAIRRKRRRHK